MDGFTPADIVIALIIGSSALWGFARGLSREALDLFSWIASAVGAYYFKDQIIEYLVPYLGTGIGSEVASFLILFVALLILLSLVTAPLVKIIKIKSLMGVNKILGLLYGIARGFLICAILWSVYIMVQRPTSTEDMALGAKMRPTVHQATWTVYRGIASLGDTLQWNRNENISALIEAWSDFLREVDVILQDGSIAPLTDATPRSSSGASYDTSQELGA